MVKKMVMKGGNTPMEERLILKRYTCEKCGHKWLPRTEERPRVCPKCKSAWWDLPRENETEEVCIEDGKQ